MSVKRVAYWGTVVGLTLGLVGLVSAISTSNYRPTLLFEHVALAADVYALKLNDLRGRYYQQIAIKQSIQKERLPVPPQLQREIDFLEDKIKEIRQKIQRTKE